MVWLNLFIAAAQCVIAAMVIGSAFFMRRIRRSQRELGAILSDNAKAAEELRQVLADHAEQHAEMPSFADLRALRAELQRHVTSNLLHAPERRE